jgi:hypothetical protein
MASVGSLLKSAASTRSTLADYQDRLQAFNYSNSAYTDSAFNAYQKYLQGRIDQLNAAGGIANASKALSLTSTLRSATKSNISAGIQRENIQMMAGNASLPDKYNLIVKQFSRAQSIGDMTLAQSLESQAYSVSQSIQLQKQQSADAAVALGKANAANEGANPAALRESLKQLNHDIQVGGMNAFDTTVKAWVGKNKSVLESLGVKLPSGVQPNYFDVVSGITGAIINHDSLAAKAYAPYDPATAQTYANDAYNLANGITPMSVLGGKNMTFQELQQAANGNGQYLYNPSTGKLVKTPQTGNQLVFDKTTGVATIQPTFSGRMGDSTYNILGNNLNSQGLRTPTGAVGHTTFLNANQVALMAKMGLTFTTNKNGTTGNGVQVESTPQSPAWVKNVLGDHGVTSIYGTPTGLQFTFDAKNGTGLSTYTVISDNNGLHGLAEESNKGSFILNGQYGFDPMGQNTGQSSGHSGGLFANLESAAKSGLGDMSTLLMGHASAMGLPGYGSDMLQGATGNYQPPVLPPLNLAPSVKLPPLHIAPPAPQPVKAPTVNPQPVAPTQSVQNAGGARQVQNAGGGGFQGGGGGAFLQ